MHFCKRSAIFNTCPLDGRQSTGRQCKVILRILFMRFLLIIINCKYLGEYKYKRMIVNNFTRVADKFMSQLSAERLSIRKKRLNNNLQIVLCHRCKYIYN